MASYISYPCGKMNQSYVLKDDKNEAVFEINLKKFKLLGASDFEFVDVKSGSATEHKVGKVVSVGQGFGGFNVNTTSYFKLDGKNVFDVLEDKGYSFQFHALKKLINPELALNDKSGHTVAVFKLNVLAERQEGVMGIGNKQRNTVIETELIDLEVIALAAFVLSRVEFSANLF